MVVQSSGALGGLRQQIFAQLKFVYTESSNLEIITTRGEATREHGRFPRRFSAKVINLETRQVILETERAGSPSTALDLLLELTSSMVQEMLNAGSEATLLEEQADEPLAIEPAQKRKKKSKRHDESNLEVAVVEDEQPDDEPAPEPSKKKKRSKKVTEPELQTAEFNADLNRSLVEQDYEELREQTSTKGRKKQSKKREESTIETNNVDAEQPMEEPEEEPVPKSRKKKSKSRVEAASQHDIAEIEQLDPEPEPEQQLSPRSGKTKRKRKSERDEPPPDASAADTEEQSVQNPRRKKSKRAADVDAVQEEIEEQSLPKSRKKKAKKLEEAIPDATNLQTEQLTEEPREESKPSKKQPQRNEKPSQAADAAADAEAISETGKKKKAKKTEKEAESSSMEQHDGSTTVGAPEVDENEQNEADRQAAKKERSRERRRQRQVAAAQASEAVTEEVAPSDPSKSLSESQHGQRINFVELLPEAGDSEQGVQYQATHAVTELPSPGSQRGCIHQDDSHTQISNAERQEEPEQDDRVAFVPVHDYDHVHPDRQRLASRSTGYMVSGGSGDRATSTQPPKTTRHRTIVPSDRVVPNDHPAARNNRPWDRTNQRHEDSRRDNRPRPYEMGDYYRPNYSKPSSPGRRYRGSLSKRDEEEQYGRIIRTSPVHNQHPANSWRGESSERRPNIKVESDEDSYEVEPASNLRDPETEARLQELTIRHNRVMALREQVAQANKRAEQAVQELKEAEKDYFIIDDSMIDPRVLAMDNDKRSGSL